MPFAETEEGAPPAALMVPLARLDNVSHVPLQSRLETIGGELSLQPATGGVMRSTKPLCRLGLWAARALFFSSR
jgi:hypothetical protein